MAHLLPLLLLALLLLLRKQAALQSGSAAVVERRGQLLLLRPTTATLRSARAEAVQQVIVPTGLVQTSNRLRRRSARDERRDVYTNRPNEAH
jgi:hypothetical protein